nr:MAG TPA: protein of unknown function (DUF4150) [Caudoviricetes sp.]
MKFYEKRLLTIIFKRCRAFPDVCKTISGGLKK